MGCVAAEPIVNGLRIELDERIAILQVDIFTPAGEQLSQAYGAFATPTFIMFGPDGEEQWRMIGTLNADRVRESLP